MHLNGLVFSLIHFWTVTSGSSSDRTLYGPCQGWDSFPFLPLSTAQAPTPLHGMSWWWSSWSCTTILTLPASSAVTRQRVPQLRTGQQLVVLNICWCDWVCLIWGPKVYTEEQERRLLSSGLVRCVPVGPWDTRQIPIPLTAEPCSILP